MHRYTQTVNREKCSVYKNAKIWLSFLVLLSWEGKVKNKHLYLYTLAEVLACLYVFSLFWAFPVGENLLFKELKRRQWTITVRQSHLFPFGHMTSETTAPCCHGSATPSAWRVNFKSISPHTFFSNPPRFCLFLFHCLYSVVLFPPLSEIHSRRYDFKICFCKMQGKYRGKT